MMRNYSEFLAEVLISEEGLQKRIKEIGLQISEDYKEF